MTATSLLTARGVRLSYGSTEILRGVDVALPVGADVVLLGRSGSGKTSLLLALAGLLPLDGGQVDGHQSSGRDVGVVFQSPSLLPELSALENVALPLRLAGRAEQDEAYQRAAAALDELGVDMFDALPGQLSGGQQQRVAVARVLALAPRVILADEPTGALDRDNAQRVLAALRRHRDQVAGALLVATHDIAVAASFAHRVTLDDGRLSQEAA